MGFRLNKHQILPADSPESLSRDLRNRSVEGLLSQQADMLRAYKDRAVDEADVALQLPTGSGKTYVGLLIAEWRRLTFNERVAYLCPTNQLVNQVVEQAIDKYGIKALAFTGTKHNYSAKDKSEYINAEAIAVTNYETVAKLS